MHNYELLVFFFAVAAIYASVGFGGGSSYLAILTLYHFPFAEMKLTALICNIIVVTGGVIIFARSGQLPWRKTIPLIVTSVPMAFIGAGLKLKEDTFFIVLGFCLVTAAILLWVKGRGDTSTRVEGKGHPILSAVMGGAIGFLSGMVGIGGGIFLAPLLNLTKWDTSKRIAATASLFILVNSISGIAGQVSHRSGDLDFMTIGFLCIAVFAGGQIGSRLGALRFNMVVVRRLTAALVFVAGVEVLSKHLHL
jgi:uncharacterized membrane protein YfcA